MFFYLDEIYSIIIILNLFNLFNKTMKNNFLLTNNFVITNLINIYIYIIKITLN